MTSMEFKWPLGPFERISPGAFNDVLGTEIDFTGTPSGKAKLLAVRYADGDAFVTLEFG